VCLIYDEHESEHRVRSKRAVMAWSLMRQSRSWTLGLPATLPPLATLREARTKQMRVPDMIDDWNIHKQMIASVRALQVIPIIASLKTLLVRSDCEQGKESHRSLWMAIHTQTNARNNLKSIFCPSFYHNPIAFVNFVCFSLVSACVSILAAFSFVCT